MYHLVYHRSFPSLFLTEFPWTGRALIVSEWKWPHARLAYLKITTRHHIVSFFHNMIGSPLQSCTDLRQVCVYQYQSLS